MLRPLTAILLCSFALLLAAQQQGPMPQPDSIVTVPKKKASPPRSEEQKQTSDTSADANGEYSSSKTYVVDLSPPLGDKQTHPDAEANSDIKEMKPWNPHRALKDVEVGDFYFKRKNYAAAEARYRDALEYKANDAVATFRLAQVLERTRRGDEAISYYQAYLKILADGPFAEECHKAIARLSKTAKK